MSKPQWMCSDTFVLHFNAGICANNRLIERTRTKHSSQAHRWVVCPSNGTPIIAAHEGKKPFIHNSPSIFKKNIFILSRILCIEQNQHSLMTPLFSRVLGASHHLFGFQMFWLSKFLIVGPMLRINRSTDVCLCQRERD